MPAASPSSPGAVQFAGSDRAFKVEEIDRRRVRRPAPRALTSSRSPPTSRRSRSPSTSRASTALNLDPDDDRRHLRRHDHQLERPGDRRDQLRRHAARPRDHARAPLRQVGHDRELHRLHGPDRPDVWTYKSVEEWPLQAGEAAQGTSGVVNAIKGGNGTIGYADHSQTKDLSAVNVQVGSDWVSLLAEGAAATLDASKVEDGRAATDLAFAIDRTTTAAGAYPVLLVSYLIGCAEYKDADQRSARQGILHDRGQRRGPAVGRRQCGQRTRSRPTWRSRRRLRSTRSSRTM